MIALALLLLWRHSYYGAVLPNTHYSKVDTTLSALRFAGTHTVSAFYYTLDGLRGSQMVLALGTLGAVAAWRERRSAIVLVLVAALAFVWYSGGDWMAFGRFYVPVLPILALMWVTGADSLRRTAPSAPRAAIALVLLVAPVVFAGFHTTMSLRRLLSNREYNPAMHSLVHEEVGRYLAAVADPADAVAVNETGAIGYYSGLRIIDLSGNTDRTIARLEREGDPAEIARHVLAMEPRFILVNNRQWPWSDGPGPVQETLHRMALSSDLYVPERAFALNHYKDVIVLSRAETGSPPARPPVEGRHAGPGEADGAK